MPHPGRCLLGKGEMSLVEGAHSQLFLLLFVLQ
jgi:hypothetical protein